VLPAEDRRLRALSTAIDLADPEYAAQTLAAVDRQIDPATKAMAAIQSRLAETCSTQKPEWVGVVDFSAAFTAGSTPGDVQTFLFEPPHGAPPRITVGQRFELISPGAVPDWSYRVLVRGGMRSFASMPIEVVARSVGQRAREFAACDAYDRQAAMAAASKK
jgi:hypothetical protein